MKAKNLNSVASITCTWEIVGFEAKLKKLRPMCELFRGIDGVFSQKRLRKCVFGQLFDSVLLSTQVCLIVALSAYLKKYSTWATINRIALLLIHKYENCYEFCEKILKIHFKVVELYL